MAKGRALAVSLLLLASPALIRGQSGVVSGRILDAGTERPVTNARIAIPSRSVEARSDSVGRFRLSNVSPGTFSLVILAVGYDSLVARVNMIAKDDVDADFILSRAATRLKPVDVKATHTLMSVRLEEFEGRRKMGLGRFLDQEYFDENKDRQLEMALISKIPGLRTRRVAGKQTLTSSREGGLCYPQVVLNGISVWNGVPMSPDSRATRDALLFDINSIQTNEVVAFEFHTPSTTPLKYNATGAGKDGSVCGTAIIWTK